MSINSLDGILAIVGSCLLDADTLRIVMASASLVTEPTLLQPGRALAQQGGQTQ